MSLCVIPPAVSADWKGQAAIKLSPTKAEILRLPRDAGTVIVGNPSYVSALLDSPKLVVLVPQQVGSTSLTILDQEGNVLIDQDILISPYETGQVKIKRGCLAGAACPSDEYYQCAENCVLVQAMPVTSSGSSGAGALVAPATEISSGINGIPADEAGFAGPSGYAE